MLDVMFLLIIFFMLGTQFVDEERQIGLRVPQVVRPRRLGAATRAQDRERLSRRHDHARPASRSRLDAT